jgi:hypothetical protein
MITAVRVEIKRPWRCGKTAEITYLPAFRPNGEVPHVRRTDLVLLAK